eukprot:1981121-Pleurochrysis_carterae.AAC.2
MSFDVLKLKKYKFVTTSTQEQALHVSMLCSSAFRQRHVRRCELEQHRSQGEHAGPLRRFRQLLARKGLKFDACAL